MHKTKFFFSIFTFFLYSSFTFSQNTIIQKTDTAGYYRLNEVVITATRTYANTLELANSISVIDSAQITRSNLDNVFDILRNETGLSYTRQGGRGSLSNIYLRGGNTSHTLVLIDGVEVNLTNDPGGVYDFSALTLDNIERIEILRGPQSTLYGSDAMAGVVNIITRKGDGPAKFSLLTEGGTYNTYKAKFGMNGSVEKFNYSLSLSRTGSDGFSNAAEKYGNTEKDGFIFNNFSSILGYNFNSDAEINFYTRFTKSRADYDQFGGEFGDDPTYIFNQEEFLIRGEGKFKFLDNIWQQKIGLSFFRNVRKYSYDTSSASVYYSRSLYDGRKYKLDWQNDFRLNENNLLTAGLEFETEEASSEYNAFNYVSLPDYISIFPKKDSRTFGAFIQNNLQIDKRFFTIFGIRLDNHNKTGSHFTYRIAPAFIVRETDTKLKATAGTGFKSPSLFYLYDPLYGNENLKPEKSFGFDFGFEQYLFNYKAVVGVTYFYNNFKDMFGFDYVTFKTLNINKAVSKGVETYFQAKPYENLDVKVNYTYTDARDMSTDSPDYNKRLLRRPENKAGLYISSSHLEKTNVNAEFIWVGKREDINFSTFERTDLKSYLLINFAAHYDIFEFLRLNFRAENLLNTEYEEVFGYGTVGISFYGGIRLSF